jgi:ribose transport system permease protein
VGADRVIEPFRPSGEVAANPRGRPAPKSVGVEVLSRARVGDVRPVAAWALALALFFTYAVLQPGVLSSSQIGTLCADTLSLATVGLGEGLVILTAGVDLSVGGVLSLGTALAATHFKGTGTTFAWGAAILAIGATAGAVNGALVGRLRLQPFIVTLATWSIFDGIALDVLPTQGGSVPSGFANWINGATAGLPNAAWALIVMAAVWLWFKQTPTARKIYALGSDSEGARTAGVHRAATLAVTYAISGLCAAVAALFYSMLTASGDPTAGNGLILPAVAAVVIGGTSLFGGQGGFIGTIAGAFTLTLLSDVIFVFNLPSYWTVFADGFLLVMAVLVGGGLRELQVRRLRK